MSLRNNRTHVIWENMKKRCTNPDHDAWKWYGGKGVAICQRWISSYRSFLSDMGEAPAGMSIDRIDNSRGYEPGNCRWATHKQQCRNRTSNIVIEYDGRRQCLMDWAIEMGLPYKTLWFRFKDGWDTERLLRQPVRRRPRK